MKDTLLPPLHGVVDDDDMKSGNGNAQLYNSGSGWPPPTALSSTAFARSRVEVGQRNPMMDPDFKRAIHEQSPCGYVPQSPQKKSSRGNSIGDLLGSVARSAVDVVEGFEQGPTPPSR